MVRTFGTWEEAVLFASYMRSEGYFTALLDECVASFYGPAAVGGIRVLVSDAPVTDEETDSTEAPDTLEALTPPTHDCEFIQAVRLATVSLVVFGLLVLGYGLMRSAQSVPGGIVSILLPPLALITLFGLVFVTLIPVIGPLTNAVRESKEEGPEGWLFWFVLLLIFCC